MSELEINNYALILGAMKSGTTSLFYYLAEHPQIAPAKEKEPHFFSYKHNFDKGIDFYKKLWDWQPENTVALEASTTYTMYPKYGNVAARIASIKNSNFKFIYIIRHPFERIKSHIRHLLSEGFQNKVEVTEEHLVYTEYGRQLDFYREVFGRDSIHILFLEDLQINPQEQLSKICQFLEINSDYKFTRINTIRNSKDTLNINPKVRGLYKNSLIKSLGTLIKPEIRQKFYGILSRKEPLKVELSKVDQKLIYQRLEFDLNKLVKEYGVDVYEKWNLPYSNIKN
jgi:hypothetical protein